MNAHVAELTGLAPEAWRLLFGRLGPADFALAIAEAPAELRGAIREALGEADWPPVEEMLARPHHEDARADARARLAKLLQSLVDAGKIVLVAPPEPAPAAPLPDIPVILPSAEAAPAPALPDPALDRIAQLEKELKETREKALEALVSVREREKAQREAQKEMENILREVSAQRRSDEAERRLREQWEADRKRIDELEKRLLEAAEASKAAAFAEKLAEARLALGAELARLERKIDSLESSSAGAAAKSEAGLGRAEKDIGEARGAISEARAELGRMKADVERQIDALGPAMEAWARQEISHEVGREVGQERVRAEGALQKAMGELTEQLAFVSRLSAKIEQVRAESGERGQALEGRLAELHAALKRQEEGMASAMDDIRAAVMLDLHARYAATQSAWQKALQELSAQAVYQSGQLEGIEKKLKVLDVDALAAAVERAGKDWNDLAQQARHSLLFWEAKARQELDGRELSSRLMRLESRLRVIEARQQA